MTISNASSFFTPSINPNQLIAILKSSKTGKKIYENTEEELKKLGLQLQIMIVSFDEMLRRHGSIVTGSFDPSSGVIRIVEGFNDKYTLDSLIFELFNASMASKFQNIDKMVKSGRISSADSYAIEKLQLERNTVLCRNTALEKIMKSKAWKQLKGTDPKLIPLGENIQEFCAMQPDHMKNYKMQFNSIKASSSSHKCCIL